MCEEESRTILIRGGGVIPPSTALCSGGEFLLQYVKEEGKERCWYAVTEDGLPAKQQSRPFTECFYTMAMTELHRATGEQKYQVLGTT